MKIANEVNVATVSMVHDGTAAPIVVPVDLRSDAIAIVSVNWSIEYVPIDNDAFWGLGIYPNPDWEESVTGFDNIASECIAKTFWATEEYNSVADWTQTTLFTHQVYCHKLIIPGRFRIISAQNWAQSNNAYAEVYYHVAYLDRAELDMLNVQWGRYRR